MKIKKQKSSPFPPGRKVVAAFDFDGTLTQRDTLLPFLIFTHGIFKTSVLLLLLAPYFCKYFCNTLSRQSMKETVLKRFFYGTPIEKIQHWGKAFAAGPLNKYLRPNALSRIQWHRSQGHRCILISASIDAYLHPWAQAAGFQSAITSELVVDERRQATGQLAGKNCWGEEKTRRLTELLGPHEGFVLYAYGDSAGDKPLLEMADHPFYRRLE